MSGTHILPSEIGIRMSGIHIQPSGINIRISGIHIRISGIAVRTSETHIPTSEIPILPGRIGVPITSTWPIQHTVSEKGKSLKITIRLFTCGQVKLKKRFEKSYLIRI
jgi:hypothetical protein